MDPPYVETWERISCSTFEKKVDDALLSLVHPELGRLHLLVVGRIDHVPQFEGRVNDSGVAKGGVGAVWQTLDKFSELTLKGVEILGILVSIDEGLKSNGNLSLFSRESGFSPSPRSNNI